MTKMVSCTSTPRPAFGVGLVLGMRRVDSPARSAGSRPTHPRHQKATSNLDWFKADGRTANVDCPACKPPDQELERSYDSHH